MKTRNTARPAPGAARKIICEIATSADGYIARADGSVDWLDRPHPPGSYGMMEFYASIDTILWGRRTLDTLLEFQRRGIPGAALDPKVKNYVFSRNPPANRPPAGAEFVTEPIPAFVRRLRATSGKHVWMMGGAGIIGSFLDAGELDEFIINVIPVFIGEGIPLIAPGRRTVELRLIATRGFDDGVVQHHYAVAR